MSNPIAAPLAGYRVLQAGLEPVLGLDRDEAFEVRSPGVGAAAVGAALPVTVYARCRR